MKQDTRKINVLSKSESVQNFAKVIEVGVGFMRNRDIAGYRRYAAFIPATVHQLKTAFGQQDFVKNYSYRNWVWLFDSDSHPNLGIDPEIILSLWRSKRGVTFEMSMRDGSHPDIDDDTLGEKVRDALEAIKFQLYQACPELLARRV
jgi:hypothetical protein